MQQQLSFREVLEARRHNKHIQWNNPADLTDPRTAAARLRSGEYVEVHVNPKFRASASARVFTIGSCFARHIEARLRERGVDVATSAFKLPPEAYVAKTNPAAALNKYNVHSIESEVLLALGLISPAKDGLVDAGDGLWWDPLSTLTKVADLDTAAQIRRSIKEVTRQIAVSDMVIITLGLNEVWLDTETGVYANIMPPSQILRRHPERFRLSLPTYSENILSLEKTISAIRAASGDRANIVITVSPVPMNATLTADDVIMANTYSKSMLRVCAQTLATDHPFVDYFPSYEMVMSSPRSLTWIEDQIHVHDAAVRFVTGHFARHYLEG